MSGATARHGVRAAFVLLLSSVCTLAQADATSAAQEKERAAKLIATLGLVESAQPVREMPGWHKPKRVVVQAPSPEQLESLRKIAPGAEFVPVEDLASAVKAVPKADVLLGFCHADVLAAANAVTWVQAFNAGMERCSAIPAFRERPILLTNMQKIAGPVMADHVMALLLWHSRELPVYAEAQKAERWAIDRENADDAFALAGRTMVIAGLGGIGDEVAKRAHAFGMRVLATRASKQAKPAYVERVGTPDQLMSMLPEADVVVNALPLVDSTRGLFNAAAFAAMKPNTFFINVGRGGSVVTNDLVQALQTRKIGGAGLDVTDPEPLPAGNPLWKMPNVVITPHISANTGRDREDRWTLVRENLRRYVAGEKMLSVVDPKRGY